MLGRCRLPGGLGNRLCLAAAAELVAATAKELIAGQPHGDSRRAAGCRPEAATSTGASAPGGA
jgi:hypothetical protein